VATEPTPKPTEKRTALIAARVAAGFTQETLAARIGVECSTVHRWESGRTLPLPIWRPELAQLLGLDNQQLAAVLGESSEATHAIDTNGSPATSPGPTPHTATATYSLDNLVTVVTASIALAVIAISGTALPGNEADTRPTELDRLVEELKHRGLMPLFEKLAARAAVPCGLRTQGSYVYEKDKVRNSV
jgi:DNA-binding XRE family transcriptional regulator